MENASKALTMAGEILLAVLILSALVAGYMNLRGYESTKEEIKNQGQYTDFNKQFDIYLKDVYGSDVLSLANKIVDYNIREAEGKGYQRIDMKVTFFNDMYTVIKGTTYGFMAGKTYTTDKKIHGQNIVYIMDTIDNLMNKKNEYGDKVYTFTRGNGVNYSYTISKLANLRTNELEELIKNSSNKSKIEDEINYYNELYLLERNIKSKIFKYNTSQYDSSSGRITYILYNYEE